MTLCFKQCIFETGASNYMCGTPLESLLNSQIKIKFISRRGAMSTQPVHPTAIAVSLFKWKALLKRYVFEKMATIAICLFVFAFSDKGDLQHTV